MTGWELVVRTASYLGETPLWDPARQALYWVNIMDGEVHRFGCLDEWHQHWTLDAYTAGLALTDQADAVLVATHLGLVVLNTRTGQVTPWSGPCWPPHPEIRPNEARVDARGRLWLGTTHLDESLSEGVLCRLDGRNVETLMTGLGIPNTLVWSPDGRWFYNADSARQTLWRYPFDETSGRIGAGEPFFSVEGQDGTIDGSAMDETGCLWTCLWGQGRMVRLRPDGRVDREIPTPVTNPTSCCFGGPDMKTLYLTSARKHLSPAQLEREPLAGSILRMRTEVAGLPIPAFRGA
ncbi:SMP-30/gluconolactonase/LRE family protein [Saccharospirillum salsuginis]|uniref:Gluconolactonase n=1 Tax=Saccharospirillum salsuginis TaxID=418750 RepID=A0A918NBC8_9GAMM|nr:SMP-30/gluconolactonase/LRE family protein [Saccharospirillum salsuginis]GGX55317.1 gluconolactonase [Saccharospirillum salsuginis]